MDRTDSRGGLLLYGAYGYTGRLTTAHAAAIGVPLTLAGRDATKLEQLSHRYGFPFRTVDLENGRSLRSLLVHHSTVLHMAGPFSRTSRPMLDACLAVGTNYLDITGEIEVFEALGKRQEEIRHAGITAIPGIGFDVAPTDCLSSYVASRVANPDTLVVAVASFAGASRGTMKTVLESIGKPVLCRRSGRLEPWTGPRSCRLVPDRDAAPQICVPVPWGDISTAYWSTGIQNITGLVRQTLPLKIATALRGILGPLLRTSLGRAVSRGLLEHLPEGPTAEQRSGTHGKVICFAMSRDGHLAAAELITSDPYDFTAHSTLRAAQALTTINTPLGLVTPSQAFGADWVLGLPGCSRTDLKRAKVPECVMQT